MAGGIEAQIDRLGELAIAVGQKFHVLSGRCLFPGIHHKNIVDRSDSDGVHALGLERIHVLHDGGHVHLVTGAGEGTRHREQGDLLALEYVVGGLPRRTLGRHHTKFGLWHSIANLDGHACDPLLEWSVAGILATRRRTRTAFGEHQISALDELCHTLNQVAR